MERIAFDTRGDAASRIVAAQDRFGSLVDMWLGDATNRCGAVEAKSLRSVVGRIKRALGERPVAEVTLAVRRTYLAALKAEGLSDRTVQNHERVLNRMFKLAAERGLVDAGSQGGAPVITLPVSQVKGGVAGRGASSTPPARGGARGRATPKACVGRGCADAVCPFLGAGLGPHDVAVGVQPPAKPNRSPAPTVSMTALSKPSALPSLGGVRSGWVQVPLARVGYWLARANDDEPLFDPRELLGAPN